MAMKRRLIKLGGRRYQIELPGGDISVWEYRDLPRHWDSKLGVYKDFEPGMNRFALSWEGSLIDSFCQEEDILCFLIRFAYNIPEHCLIPSEILSEFWLGYEVGDWVDEWGCLDQHRVIFTYKINFPPKRKLRFGSPTPLVSYISRDSSQGRRTKPARIQSRIRKEDLIVELDFTELEKPRKRRRTIPRVWTDWSDPSYEFWMRSKLENLRRKEQRDWIPDEECVFELKSGQNAENVH